jgi:hypothetical protein
MTGFFLKGSLRLPPVPQDQTSVLTRHFAVNTAAAQPLCVLWVILTNRSQLVGHRR